MNKRMLTIAAITLFAATQSVPARAQFMSPPEAPPAPVMAMVVEILDDINEGIVAQQELPSGPRTVTPAEHEQIVEMHKATAMRVLIRTDESVPTLRSYLLRNGDIVTTADLESSRDTWYGLNGRYSHLINLDDSITYVEERDGWVVIGLNSPERATQVRHATLLVIRAMKVVSR